MQPVARDPPTYILRLHEIDSSWEYAAPYVGVATVTVVDEIATIQGLVLRRGSSYSRETKRALIEAARMVGARKLIGTRRRARTIEWITGD